MTNGKRAKQQRNQARKLAAEMSAAIDMEWVASSHQLVGRLEFQAVNLRTHLGPGVGVGVVFHMQDGQRLGPVVLDPMDTMRLVAGCSAIIIGQAPPGSETGPSSESELAVPSPDQLPTTQTESGLHLPVLG